jgi:NADPH:quinone reductase-like Zn-dependent oxidoreductase
VQPDERVLIHGAAGPVGHWLIQLAKEKGAQVIATASGAGLDGVQALGADTAMDYRNARFEDAGTVDVIFDLIGGETRMRSWAILGAGGRLLSTAMPPDTAKAEAIGARAMFVFTPPDGQVLADIVQKINAGTLKPLPIAREMALKDAAESHRLGESGKAGGKMALIPENDR